MKTVKFPRGTTEESNAYIGPQGQVTVDTDRNEIRLHDGVTPGGARIPNIETLVSLFRASADDPLGEGLPEAGLGIIVRVGDGAYNVREVITTLGGITITNGAGQGGNIGVALDILSLDEGVPDTSADYIVAYDTSLAGNAKILFDDFFGLIIQLPTLAAVDAPTDYAYLYDASTNLAKIALIIDILESVNTLTELTEPAYTADYIMVYDSSATTVKKVKLQSMPLGGIPHVILQQRQNQGTGGNSCNSGADRTMTLNTETLDTLGITSLTANQFPLPAGTYFARWMVPFSGTADSQSWLHNITDNTVVDRGTSGDASTSTAFNTTFTSTGTAYFTIAGTKTFALKGRSSANGAFGAAGNHGQEVLGGIEIWKIA